MWVGAYTRCIENGQHCPSAKTACHIPAHFRLATKGPYPHTHARAHSYQVVTHRYNHTSTQNTIHPPIHPHNSSSSTSQAWGLVHRSLATKYRHSMGQKPHRSDKGHGIGSSRGGRTAWFLPRRLSVTRELVPQAAQSRTFGGTLVSLHSTCSIATQLELSPGATHGQRWTRALAGMGAVCTRATV